MMSDISRLANRVRKATRSVFILGRTAVSGITTKRAVDALFGVMNGMNDIGPVGYWTSRTPVTNGSMSVDIRLGRYDGITVGLYQGI